MKHFILGLLCGVLFMPVYATATTPKTEIVTDQEAGIIRFIVNGKEVAQINSNGLSIRDDLEYGGMVTDIGNNYGGNHYE